jgi:hypothetical protein
MLIQHAALCHSLVPIQSISRRLLKAIVHGDRGRAQWQPDGYNQFVASSYSYSLSSDATSLAARTPAVHDLSQMLLPARASFASQHDFPSDSEAMEPDIQLSPLRANKFKFPF